MAIVGCVEGGDKGALGFIERVRRGSRGFKEIESLTEGEIACPAHGLEEHKASAPLCYGRMVVKSLSAAKSVVRWHNAVASG